MKVVMIRHAQTEGNLKKQYVGTQDVPLCTQEIETLRKQGRYPNIQRVYASSMCRTMQTAQQLFPKACIFPCDNLREINLGVLENKSCQIKPDLSDWMQPFPGGKSIFQLSQRVTRGMEDSIENEWVQGAEYVIFVMHGVGIMTVLQQFSGKPCPCLFSWYTGNGCAWSFEVNNPCLYSAPLKKLEYHESLKLLTEF